MNWGGLSLLPLIVALAIAFTSRSAVFSLLLGCVVGVIMLGSDPARGLNSLFQAALASREFIWVCMIVVLIGVLFALFRHVGVVAAFAKRISVESQSPRRIGFTAWGAYITSLILVQKGPVSNAGEAMSVFVHAIPYNFYSILLVVFTLGICLKLIPDFGPMRKAEHRASTTGAVLREGAMPLINTEGLNVVADQGRGEASLVADLLVPVVCVFSIVIGSFIWLQEVLIVEGFLVAVTYLSISLLLRRRIGGIEELVRIATEGVKDVMPAIMVVALAYCINHVTQSLGAADYLVAITARFFTPELLVAATFLLTALISFSTGTSWGAFALIMPIALPMAYAFTGGQVDPLVFKTVAAVTGGGIFGDHASPVSDTSVLSSAGAGSDHMDHVITQLPYALVVAACTLTLYLLV